MEKYSGLCIKIPKGVRVDVDRKKIIKAFYESRPEALEHIRYVSQQFNNYTWVISFDKAYDYSKLEYSSLNIDGYSLSLCEVVDPKKFRYASYRVLWLPHGFPIDKVRKMFEINGVKILDVSEEKFQVEDVGDMWFSTGNFRVKVQVDNDKDPFIRTGVVEINKMKVLISKIGEKPRCLRCSEQGHIRRNCPLNGMICTKCHKTGHVAENCSLAKRIAKEDEEFPDEADEEDDQPDDQPILIQNDVVKQGIKRNKQEDSSPLSDTNETKMRRNDESEENDSNDAQDDDDMEHVIDVQEIQDEFYKNLSNGKCTDSGLVEQVKEKEVDKPHQSKVPIPSNAKKNSQSSSQNKAQTSKKKSSRI